MEETIAKKQKLSSPSKEPDNRSSPVFNGYESDDYDDPKFEPYFRSVEESQGYDVIDFPSEFVMCAVLPVDRYDFVKNYEFYKSVAQFAIDENNKNNETNFQLVEVNKVNYERCAGEMYYLTLVVKNNDDLEPKCCEYQAKVFEELDGSLDFVEFRKRKLPQAEIHKQEGNEA